MQCSTQNLYQIFIVSGVLQALQIIDSYSKKTRHQNWLCFVLKTRGTGKMKTARECFPSFF